jgi:hypothetical protein
MASPGGPDDREAASASAVIVNLSTLVAFCIVAIWTLVVDAGVAALRLAFRVSRRSRSLSPAPF